MLAGRWLSVVVVAFGASWARADTPVVPTFPAAPDAEARIHAALEKTVDLQLTDGQLGDLAHYLETTYRIPVALDEASLTGDGKGPETIINVHLADVRLRSALNHIGDQEGLAFVCHEEKLLITTKSAEEYLVRSVVYPVGDLLDLTHGAVYPPSYGDPQQLISLIEGTIACETWRNAGGVQGTMEFLPQRQALAVTQTGRLQERVASLLEQLRKTRPPEAKTSPREPYVVVYRVPLVRQTKTPSMFGGMSGSGMSGGTGMYTVASEALAGDSHSPQIEIVPAVVAPNDDPTAVEKRAETPSAPAEQATTPPDPPEVIPLPPRSVPYIDFPHTGYLLPAERDAFVEGLQLLVEPDSWHMSGGDGRIIVVCDKLYVRQTARVHEQIRVMIDALWDEHP